MIHRFLFLVFAILSISLSACSRVEEPVASVSASDPLLAPEQAKSIQVGLFSSDEAQQLAALMALENFPQMRSAFRDRIQQLSSSSSEEISVLAKKISAATN